MTSSGSAASSVEFFAPAEFVARLDAQAAEGEFVFANFFRGDGEDVRAVVADVGANLEGEQRLFEREIGHR